MKYIDLKNALRLNKTVKMKIYYQEMDYILGSPQELTHLEDGHKASLRELQGMLAPLLQQPLVEEALKRSDIAGYDPIDEYPEGRDGVLSLFREKLAPLQNLYDEIRGFIGLAELDIGHGRDPNPAIKFRIGDSAVRKLKLHPDFEGYKNPDYLVDYTWLRALNLVQDLHQDIKINGFMGREAEPESRAALDALEVCKTQLKTHFKDVLADKTVNQHPDEDNVYEAAVPSRIVQEGKTLTPAENEAIKKIIEKARRFAEKIDRDELQFSVEDEGNQNVLRAVKSILEGKVVLSPATRSDNPIFLLSGKKSTLAQTPEVQDICRNFRTLLSKAEYVVFSTAETFYQVQPTFKLHVQWESLMAKITALNDHARNLTEGHPIPERFAAKVARRISAMNIGLNFSQPIRNAIIEAEPLIEKLAQENPEYKSFADDIAVLAKNVYAEESLNWYSFDNVMHALQVAYASGSSSETPLREALRDTALEFVTVDFFAKLKSMPPMAMVAAFTYMSFKNPEDPPANSGHQAQEMLRGIFGGGKGGKE